MTPMFWCIQCSGVEYSHVTASWHQLPPINHTEIRQIGTLP